MISKVIAEIFVYFKEILGRCALCRFSLAVFVCSSVCLVDIMVAVDSNNLNTRILLELFKPCGKLSVGFILTVGGEITRRIRYFMPFFLACSAIPVRADSRIPTD